MDFEYFMHGRRPRSILTFYHGFMRLVTAVAVLALPLLAQTGATVEGTVSDAVTGAPVGGVKVSLTSFNPGAPAVKAYAAQTDPSGTFRIEGVREGVYIANFEERGYLDLPREHSAALPFRVMATRDVIRLRAELRPLGKLRGRVSDDDGKPVAGVGVELARARGGFVNTATTDAEGHFAFETVVPGRYVLSVRPAKPKPGGGATFWERVALKPPADPDGRKLQWVKTYFPAATDRQGAEPIIVRAGMNASGYDLRLRATPVYKLKGTVVDDTADPAGGVTVDLVPSTAFIPEQVVRSNPDGSFEFEGVPEGEWRLLARHKSERGVFAAYGKTNIAGADTDRVELRLLSPFTVQGTVNREEPADSSGKRKVTMVYLMPADGQPEKRATAAHDQEGKFQINRVQAGRYRILAVGILPGYYVESILFGGRDVTAEEVDLMPGAPPIQVNYKDRAGVVRGKIDKNGNYTVILVPKDEGLLEEPFLRLAISRPDGSFEIGSVRPGEYYAAAFDRVDPDALRDAVFVRGLASFAENVRIGQGESVSLNMRLQQWPEY